MAYWTPDQLSPHEWWDAETIDGDDAAAITAWEGYNHRTLAGAATLQTAFVNGRAAVDFDGTDDFFALTDFDVLSQPVSVFAVWKMADSASQTLLYSESTGTITGIASGSTYEVNGGTSLAGAITKGAWRMTGALFNTTASAYSIDGTTTTGNGGGEGFGPDLFVGATSAAGTQSALLTGQIATMILLDRVWTTDERQLLEGWGAWTYGLMGNLASTHPWKTTRPPA
jgi:hypothetical protein